MGGAETEECCEETPLDEVFELVIESMCEFLSASRGGFGDLDGLEFRDMSDGDRDDGKDESEARGFSTLPFELVVPFVVDRYI